MDLWFQLGIIFIKIAYAGLAICCLLGLFIEFFRNRIKKIKNEILSVIIVCFWVTFFFSISGLVSLAAASENLCI
jgi:ABC-type spermidine/putrescine transport system permease subunit I